MPRVDETGKRLSGHAQRKADEEAREKRETSDVDDGSDYRVLGKPDLNSPDLGLAYVRKAQLVAFYQMCVAELPQMEKWKLIREMSAAIGLTHPRSVVETRAANLEKGAKKARQHGATQIETNVARPATARSFGGPLDAPSSTETSKE